MVDLEKFSVDESGYITVTHAAYDMDIIDIPHDQYELEDYFKSLPDISMINEYDNYHTLYMYARKGITPYIIHDYIDESELVSIPFKKLHFNDLPKHIFDIMNKDGDISLVIAMMRFQEVIADYKNEIIKEKDILSEIDVLDRNEDILYELENELQVLEETYSFVFGNNINNN